MPHSRRVILGLGAGLAAFGAGAPLRRAAAATPSDDPRFAERAVGRADAPVTVIEFYSLTCSHCAAFSRDTMPRVHRELIEAGRLRLVYWDFPLDQVALMATAIARSLPPERYEPFVTTLLATQDRWAFARGVNTTEELARMAALAGMPREAFNRAIADTELRTWILTRREEASKSYGIEATPSFAFKGPKAKDRVESGALGYDAFAKYVAAAG
ncbi:Periplasmic thiol:disulfide interchange protein DsbA [Rhodovastum atsumiense]|nr:thioredoxin domain-containing protein [Rhodovastum atsumiense]CAH2600134.1 Periplasmic thiol:disulfide interchange protein DsbA [Rhodovastum atsumiense]